MRQIIFSVGVALPGGGMGNYGYYLVEGLDRAHLLEQAFVMRYYGDGIDPGRVKTLYFTEKIAYRLARYTRGDQYVLRDNLFDFWVSRQLTKTALFYGWTHHALWSFKQAKRKNMLTVLERANSHPSTYTRLLEDEYKKYGVTGRVYHPLTFQKQLKEIELADYIAVASLFTRQSLVENGIDEQRILLTPLGVDTNTFVPNPSDSPDNQDIFRVVYVGQLCLRKGVQYLLEAWQKLQLRNAELVLLGDVVDEFTSILQHYRSQNQNITLLPYNSKPVEVYQQASVSILPTLEDGFGLVVLESMACGVPVIVTEHAGVKECVRQGIDGFIIPPYSAEKIAEVLEYCYTHRTHLSEIGHNAREQAKCYSWTRYQDGVVAHLKPIIS